ncbi:MAG: hypothetical protein V1837_05685 [Candidatus Woesearchaeota archaeon]
MKKIPKRSMFLLDLVKSAKLDVKRSIQREHPTQQKAALFVLAFFILSLGAMYFDQNNVRLSDEANVPTGLMLKVTGNTPYNNQKILSRIESMYANNPGLKEAVQKAYQNYYTLQPYKDQLFLERLIIVESNGVNKPLNGNSEIGFLQIYSKDSGSNGGYSVEQLKQAQYNIDAGAQKVAEIIDTTQFRQAGEDKKFAEVLFSYNQKNPANPDAINKMDAAGIYPNVAPDLAKLLVSSRATNSGLDTAPSQSTSGTSGQLVPDVGTTWGSYTFNGQHWEYQYKDDKTGKMLKAYDQDAFALQGWQSQYNPPATAAFIVDWGTSSYKSSPPTEYGKGTDKTGTTLLFWKDINGQWHKSAYQTEDQLKAAFPGTISTYVPLPTPSLPPGVVSPQGTEKFYAGSDGVFHFLDGQGNEIQTAGPVEVYVMGTGTIITQNGQTSLFLNGKTYQYSQENEAGYVLTDKGWLQVDSVDSKGNIYVKDATGNSALLNSFQPGAAAQPQASAYAFDGFTASSDGIYYTRADEPNVRYQIFDDGSVLKTDNQGNILGVLEAEKYTGTNYNDIKNSFMDKAAFDAKAKALVEASTPLALTTDQQTVVSQLGLSYDSTANTWKRSGYDGNYEWASDNGDVIYLAKASATSETYTAQYLPKGADKDKGWINLGSDFVEKNSYYNDYLGLYVLETKSGQYFTVINNQKVEAKPMPGETDIFDSMQIKGPDGEFRPYTQSDNGQWYVTMQNGDKYTYSQFVNNQMIGTSINQVYQAAQGGRALSILLGMEDSAWRRATDQFFVYSVLGQVISGNWEETACQHYISRPPEGTMYITIPDGANMVGIGAHVEADRQLIEFTNASGYQQQFFYKISLFVKNPEKPSKSGQSVVQEMNFNVVLIGPGKQTTLFKQDINVQPGKTFSKTGSAMIVQFSNNLYKQICIQFKEPVFSADGVETSEVCNIITEFKGSPTGYVPQAQAAATSSTSKKAEVNTI